FPGSEALVFHVSGCTFTNVGFDGASYQRLWPDGNTRDHPTPFQFTSPKTGPNYNQQFAQAAFETDLPAVEGTCDTLTGAGCTLIPQTDQGTPAQFYPFYTTTSHNTPGGGCYWQFGNDIPQESNNFGQNAEYGVLQQQNYTTRGGGVIAETNTFRNIINNPCPSE